MKLSHFFAISLIAVLGFASNAQAIGINPSPLGTLTNPLVAGDSGNYSLGAQQNSSIIDTLNGYLDSNTQISITYSYSGINPYYMSVDATGANSQGQATASIGAMNNPNFTLLPSSNTSTSVGLPLIVMANLSNDTGTAVIQNLDSSMASFSSLFKAFVFGNSGIIDVSYNVSSIPLPPAFVLFALGLLTLAGFGMYKKAHGRV